MRKFTWQQCTVAIALMCLTAAFALVGEGGAAAGAMIFTTVWAMLQEREAPGGEQ